MGIYYVDQRNPINGNGATADIANGATGPMNVIWKACKRNAPIPDGVHTIEVIEGSGPYHYNGYNGMAAQAYSVVNFLYPEQQNNSILTWNFNGNELRGDINVNDPIYGFIWHYSPSTGLYYLTNSIGGSPSLRDATGYSLPKTVIIDGYWNDDSMNLTGAIPGHWYNNWKYGDFDSLGFSTLYVKWEGGDPTGEPVEILVGQVDSVFFGNSASGFTSTNLVNDAVLCGGQLQGVKVQYPIHLRNTKIFNSGSQGLQIDNAACNGSTVYSCIFDRCGHRGVNVIAAANVDAYNNHFERVHLALRLASDAAYTINLINNSSRDLYAGFIQKDVALPTLNEDYNQIHLDVLSGHVPTIAFTTATRQWTTTAAHDLPANTATSLQTSVDPLMVSSEDFRLTTTSPCIATGTDVGLREDAYGNHIYGLPNIGATERVPVAPVISDDFFIGSDGTIAMEGQIRDPKVTN